MVLLHNKPPEIAIIVGKYVMSANAGCTDVIGGTMTAASLTAAQGSALITWAPAFISAPIVIASLNSGALTVTSPSVRFTGVTACGGYVMMATGNNACSQAAIGIMVIGEARL